MKRQPIPRPQQIHTPVAAHTWGTGFAEFLGGSAMGVMGDTPLVFSDFIGIEFPPIGAAR